MKKLAITLVWIFLSISSVVNAASDEELLTSMLNEFLAGASVSDVAAHERFWADDLIYTSSSGLRFGKADILEGMKAEPEAGDEEPEVVYSAEDIQIQLHGDSAVVAFRLLGTPAAGSGELMQFFNTGTFVKRNGQWQVVAWQATIIPDAE
ncbi:nuclear transport factor 2 family protein [Pseudomonadota bacterium]